MAEPDRTVPRRAGRAARAAWNLAGALSLGIGMVGIPLPILPTVPFLILAAWCFARGNPRLEAWLVGHPRFGTHIRSWRSHGAIGRTAKRSAFVALAVSAALGFLLLPFAWSLLPMAFCLAAAAWIHSRPEA